jgi:hypothetical protein
MPRTLTRENLALRLDEGEVTFLEKVQGGWIYAQVENEHRGLQGYVKKHIGQPKYEDFTIQVRSILSQALFDWIAASWTTHAPRRDGSILTCDHNLSIQSERSFSNALIQEVGFPALDASSKEPAYLTVRLSPEKIAFKKGGGKLSPGNLGKQKLWQTANFRLEIDGLETKLVRRIEPFTIKRILSSKAGKIDFPNLIISLAQSGAQSWIDWHEDFVIKGNNDDQHEREGAIAFLAPNLKAELARIELHNVGIFRLENEASQENKIGSLRAELYCEQMEFQLGKG